MPISGKTARVTETARSLAALFIKKSMSFGETKSESLSERRVTVGVPTETTGKPRVFSFRAFLFPEIPLPGAIPLSLSWIVLQI